MEEEILDPTLNELFESNTLKWIFVGGKGGVGKTTSSCSIAVELAKRKDKVLIISTDPAHNLSDAFTQKFNSKPTLINGFSNLYAMEIDAKFQDNVGFDVEDDTTGLGKMLPELLSAFPGIDEAMGFAELMQSVQSMEYSTIVFDTAPTGHTLRLLSFPALLEKGLAKASEMRDQLGGVMHMASMMAGNEVDPDSLQNRLDGLRAVTNSVRQTFSDPTKTTFVCVCIPEFLSVYETERLVQELARQNIDCSNIVVNQVLFPIEDEDAAIKMNPRALDASEHLIEEIQKLNLTGHTKNLVDAVTTRLAAYESNFFARRRMQQKYLSQVRDLYGYDFHVVCVPLQREEVRGIQGLKHFGKMLQTPRALPENVD